MPSIGLSLKMSKRVVLKTKLLLNGYLRPDGTSYYLRPDGTSTYKQPE